MKLAEALQLRADLQKRMEQLAGRLYDNATVQEGEQPAEDPAGLLAEYEDCAGQLEDLMARINRTNCETKTDRGWSASASFMMGVPPFIRPAGEGVTGCPVPPAGS